MVISMCILLRNDNSYSYMHVIVCIDISLLLTFWFLYSETILDKVQSSDKFQVDEFHCLTDILAGRIAAIHPVTTVYLCLFPSISKSSCASIRTSLALSDTRLLDCLKCILVEIYSARQISKCNHLPQCYLLR